MYNLIENLDQYNQIVEESSAVLMYFSHEKCSVCVALKPKIEQLITQNFPKIGLYYIDTVKKSEIAAQNSIFINPVLMIYFDKKLFQKKVRNISINELKNELSRPYSLIFE